MRKYFLGCNQTLENIFLFRKIEFPENIYFPKNILRNQTQPQSPGSVYAQPSCIKFEIIS